MNWWELLTEDEWEYQRMVEPTGLLDIDGNEIYAGDVIELETLKRQFVVQWNGSRHACFLSGVERMGAPGYRQRIVS